MRDLNATTRSKSKTMSLKLICVLSPISTQSICQMRTCFPGNELVGAATKKNPSLCVLIRPTYGQCDARA